MGGVRPPPRATHTSLAGRSFPSTTRQCREVVLAMPANFGVGT